MADEEERSLFDMTANRVDFTLHAIPDSLCGTCCMGHVIRRRKNMDSQARHVDVFCRRIDRRVPPDIAECTGYCKSTEMHKDEMERLVQEAGTLLKIDTRPHPGQFL